MEIRRDFAVLQSVLFGLVSTTAMLAMSVTGWAAQPVPVVASVASSTVSRVSGNLIHLDKIPFAVKKPDFGGETCIAMYLRSLGHNVTADDVFDASGVDPLLGRGCVARELVVAAKQIGFATGDVWYEVDNDGLDQVWNNVLRDLKNNRPSVVCRIHENKEQFVLVVGFDSAADKIIFHDPNVANGKDSTSDRATFLASWRLSGSKLAQNRSSVVCFRLEVRRLKVKPSAGYTDADYAQHVRKLKQRLPNDEFKIVLQKPFVVVGDGSPAQLKRSAVGTVKWAVDSIKKDFFESDPHHIIDVWLFKDPESYQKHNLALFNSRPGTPYGYYSPTHRVLVMDISTGGGTLVHEIVHPFMESNFDACPSWFNEGLASLYEQSSMRNGHIIGLTNWRLRGLQLSIQDGRLSSFEELCSTSTREFYDGASTNYAQARYLCYYLQEKGLLVKYFHKFRENVDDDTTGFETLKKVLGRDDMDQFQTQWEKYVLKLRFGN